MGGRNKRATVDLKHGAVCFGYEHKEEDLKEIKFPENYQSGLLAAALIGYSYENDVTRVYKGDRKTKSRQGWIRCDGCGMNLQFKKDDEGLFHVSGIRTKSGDIVSESAPKGVGCTPTTGHAFTAVCE